MITIQKSLFRDSSHRLLGGVCAGLSHYFGIDKSLVRVAFLLATFFFGLTIPIYIICWALIPKARSAREKAKMNGDFFSKEQERSSNTQNRRGNSLSFKSSLLSKVIKLISLFLGSFILFFAVGLACSSPLVLELFWDIEIKSVNVYFNPVIDLFASNKEFGVSQLVTFLVALLPGLVLFLKGIELNEKRYTNRVIGVWIFLFVLDYFFLK